MKKIIMFLLSAVTLISFVSCSKEYKPVKSTKEEAKVVMTVSADGEEYDIRYELYRAFFLTYKEQIDGGDASVWSGENADEYIAEINELIAENAATIYSTLHYAEKLDIDPYSKDFEEKISEYIKLGVEGNGSDIKGHGGDYDAYLASLKQMNLNYSVSTLLLRYQLALEAINEYYAGRDDEVLGNLGGKQEIKAEDVEEYYYSEDCARVLHIFYGEGVKTDSELQKVRDDISEKSSDLDVALYIINRSLGLESELIKNNKVSGSIIGKYVLNDLYYSDYTEAAFALQKGEVSDIIKIKGDNAGAYIIYKLDKSQTHFTDEFDTIKLSYIDNLIGKQLFELKSEMIQHTEYNKNYNDINHSAISMDW